MTIETKLGRFLAAPYAPAETLRIAVAYATRGGVERLQAFVGSALKNAEVLVGLDDYVTEPEALGLLRASCREVRTTKTAQGDHGRFHPKFYWRYSASRGAWYVGSANLTPSALDHNVEAGVVSRYEGDVPEELASLWSSWWEAGQSIEETLVGYFEDRARHVADRSAPTGSLSAVGSLANRDVTALSVEDLLALRESITSLEKRLEEVNRELDAQLLGTLERDGRPTTIGAWTVRLTTRRGWDSTALTRIARRYSIPFESLFRLTHPLKSELIENAFRAYRVADTDAAQCRRTSQNLSIEHAEPSVDPER